MIYYFAPMEGITTATFRKVHHARFAGADRYYTPFFSPTCDHILTPREQRELLPENNGDVPVVPQILTKNAEDFLWAARELTDMGYREVNLNLGCPSATVTAKGKGSGMLLHPAALAAMLEEIYARTPIPVSIKTRIGYHEASEWERLLAIYNQYPVAELTVHPRTRKEMYAGAIHDEALEYALTCSKAPLCFNGDLFTPEDVRASEESYPRVPARMMARGAVTDPALFRVLRGGEPATREEILAFCQELQEAYRSWLDPLNTMRRMKELWSLIIGLFEDNGEAGKRLARAKSTYQFDEAVSYVMGQCPLGRPSDGTTKN